MRSRVAEYPKHRVDGATVLVLEGDRANGIGIFAMKQRCIPVGIEFRRAGNGWGVLDFAAWNLLRPECQAGPDAEPSPRSRATDR